MKKKKILFVMESLKVGGAEKSLLTILELIDKKKYDIDLFLFEEKGELLKYIPKDINVLKCSKKYNVFINNRKLSPINFLLNGDSLNQ